MAIEDRTTVPASQEKLHEVTRCGGGGPRPGSATASRIGPWQRREKRSHKDPAAAAACGRDPSQPRVWVMGKDG